MILGASHVPVVGRRWRMQRGMSVMSGIRHTMHVLLCCLCGDVSCRVRLGGGWWLLWKGMESRQSIY